ncbi:SsrA-binding protein SmpB [Chloroflexota bacterium]
MPIKVISHNRKAFHDYLISDTIEAGIVLTGTEIKSIRAGKVNIRDAYARPDDKEMWLLNSHISHYDKGNRYNHEPMRPRKLLMHKRQIQQLSSKAREKGLTLVPLKLYIKDGVAKIELGLGKGKKIYDKRESIAKRDSDRDMARSLRRPR